MRTLTIILGCEPDETCGAAYFNAEDEKLRETDERLTCDRCMCRSDEALEMVFGQAVCQACVFDAELGDWE